MATKRGATTELNHDNWDGEDEKVEQGYFQKASSAELSHRVIKKAKRRGVKTSNETSETPPIFTGFKGFGSSTPNNNFDFLKKPNGDSIFGNGSSDKKDEGSPVEDKEKELPKITNPLSSFASLSKWTCNTCLVPNKNEDSSCVCCSTSKPGSESSQPGPKAFKFGSNAGFSFDNKTSSSGFKFETSEPASSSGFKFESNTVASSSVSGFKFESNSSPVSGFKFEEKKATNTSPVSGFKFDEKKAMNSSPVSGFKFEEKKASNASPVSGFKFDEKKTTNSSPVYGFKFDEKKTTNSSPVSGFKFDEKKAMNSSPVSGFKFDEKKATNASPVSGFKFEEKKVANASPVTDFKFDEKKVSSPQISGFSFDSNKGASTLGSKSLSTGFSFGSTNNNNSPSTYSHTPSSETSTNSTKDDPNKYISNLKALNRQVSKWIKSHVDENPNVILSPVFKDYEKHLQELKDKYLSETDKNKEDSKETFHRGSFWSVEKKETENKEKSELCSSSKFSSFGDSAFGNSFANTSTGSTSTFTFGAKSTTTTSPAFTFGSKSSTGFSSFGNNESTGAATTTTSVEDDEPPPKVEINVVEEKDALYSIRCKLYYKKGTGFTEKGLGMLHLKKVDGNKIQFIVRAETNLGNIFLNVLLHESMTFTQRGNNVQFVTVPNPPIVGIPEGPVTLLIKVKDAECAQALQTKIKEIFAYVQ